MNSNPEQRTVSHYIGVVLAFGLIGLAVYFVYLLVTSSDQTRLAVLTAAVTVGTLVYTQSKNTRREIDGRQFAKKAEAYEEIFKTINDLMRASRQGTPVNEKKLVDRLMALQPKLLVWAGPSVLRAWQKMASPSDEPLASLVAGNELMAAMRQELGHATDNQLGPLGLVATYIRADERPNREVV